MKQTPVNIKHLTWEYCAQGHQPIKYQGLACPHCALLKISAEKDKKIKKLAQDLVDFEKAHDRAHDLRSGKYTGAYAIK